MRRPECYRIHIQGHLDQQWAECFEAIALTQNEDGTTTLSGTVVDQAALYGLLDKLRDLRVQLISVQRIELDQGTARRRRQGAWKE